MATHSGACGDVVRQSCGGARRWSVGRRLRARLCDVAAPVVLWSGDKPNGGRTRACCRREPVRGCHARVRTAGASGACGRTRDHAGRRLRAAGVLANGRCRAALGYRRRGSKPGVAPWSGGAWTDGFGLPVCTPSIAASSTRTRGRAAVARLWAITAGVDVAIGVVRPTPAHTGAARRHGSVQTGGGCRVQATGVMFMQ